MCCFYDYALFQMSVRHMLNSINSSKWMFFLLLFCKGLCLLEVKVTSLDFCLSLCKSWSQLTVPALWFCAVKKKKKTPEIPLLPTFLGGNGCHPTSHLSGLSSGREQCTPHHLLVLAARLLLWWSLKQRCHILSAGRLQCSAWLLKG